MLRITDGRGRRRTLVATLAVTLTALALTAASPASAGPLTGASPLADAPIVTAAAVKPVPLSKAGLRVSAATLDGRSLSVKVRASRPVSVTFAVVSGTRVLASVRSRVAKGTRTLKLTLPSAPAGSGLRLRVSAPAPKKRTARGTIGLRVLRPTAPSGPAPSTPVTTTPTTTTTTTTTTTPPPPPPPDPKVTLTPAAIAENQPAGTTVGALAAVDAATVGGAPQFTLVAGTGDADNAAFTIDGTTLKTAASFNYEARSSYAIRVRAQDGGAVETPLTVTVTDVNEQPAGVDVQFLGSNAAFSNTTLVIWSGRSGLATVTGRPQRTESGDLLSGATDPDGDALTTVAETKATSDGGSVTIETDGDFVYRPPAGCSGGNDDFEFTVSDGRGGTDLRFAFVERKSSFTGPCPWYVDASAAPGGNGTASAPFASLASLSGVSDPDDADDEIFLAAGTYAGPFTLESGQKLHTARHGLTTFSETLATPNPAASTTITGSLGVSANNAIQGLNLGTASGLPALAGAVTGSLTMNTVTPGSIDNPQGAAVDLTGGTLNVALSSVSSANASGGSPSAIRLNGSAGSFNAAAGTVQSASGPTVALTGSGGSGTVNFTYGGTVTDTSGTIVDINNQGGGTKDFNGQLYSLSTDGITLGANTGATVRFDGGMTLQRNSGGPVLNATGGGLLAITDPAGPSVTNQLRAVLGQVLNVSGTTIAPDGLTFASLGASGSTSGVVLSNTGSSGGLTVLGAGSSLESGGGTIAGMTGPAVSLTNVGGPVSLTGMTIQNGTGDGVFADDVANLTVANSAFVQNGDSAADHAVDLTTGAVATGTKRLTVTGSSVVGSATAIGRGVSAGAAGTATLKASVQNSTFTGVRPQSILVETTSNLAAAPVIETEIKNNTIGNGTARSGSITDTAISVRAVGRGQVRADVSNNQLQQYARGIVLEQTYGDAYGSGTKGRLDAKLSGNTLTNPNTTDNPNADGVQVNAGVFGGDAGTLCLDLGANALSTASATGIFDLRARKVEGSDLLLPAYLGTSQDAAAATVYLSARVGPGIDVLAEDLGTGSFAPATCIAPTVG